MPRAVRVPSVRKKERRVEGQRRNRRDNDASRKATLLPPARAQREQRKERCRRPDEQRLPWRQQLQKQSVGDLFWNKRSRRRMRDHAAQVVAEVGRTAESSDVPCYVNAGGQRDGSAQYGSGRRALTSIDPRLQQ